MAQTKSTPVAPHFFKIILEETLRNTKLQIPKTFWMKYCGFLPSQVFLKLPCGSRWEVGLTESDGKVWIEKGWKFFAEDCSLSQGNLLVFRYEGNSQFHVIIFDKTTVEIDYPSNPNHFEKRVDTEDDVSIEVLDGFAWRPQIRDKSPLPCSRPHKKMKTSPYGKYKVKFDLSDKERGESPLPRWMEPEFFFKKQMLSAEKKAEALKITKGFKSKDPFFMVSMRPSFVEANYTAIIPSLFAKHYLLSISKHQYVTLKVQDRRTWSVRYRLCKKSPKTIKTIFGCGWKAFAQDNDLKVGDVCAFVLRKSIGKMLFEVVIYRGNGVANPPMLPELKAMPKGSRSSKVESCNTMINRRTSLKPFPCFGKTTALERASCSYSERPSFTVTMRETYASGHCNFFMPCKFVEKYINQKECEVRLWVSDGRFWFVQLKVRQANGLPRSELLSRGWKAFALDNSLKTGDLCTFELTNNGNEISFRVSIVKGAGDAYSNQAANKRKATIPSNRKRKPSVKVGSSFTQNYDKTIMISQKLVIKKEQEKIKVEPSGLGRASEAASQFFSKNPYFQVVLLSIHVDRYQLPFPWTFVSLYLKEKTQVMTLWVGEECWQVKLLHYTSKCKFSAGWSAFARENFLQPRDICIFELIKRSQPEMKVHIFRHSGLAQEE
ncbi:B3 domain-containing protein REM6-like [Humulus lupulus]|uniref:B3 domain-containing protein REM6-like n=1 Tax=Humulus lupulus TaxID=3486 RepID=UPI002B41306F|nr:B3 domain-containing protein REM6-like [Humulus lupulus]